MAEKQAPNPDPHKNKPATERQTREIQPPLTETPSPGKKDAPNPDRDHKLSAEEQSARGPKSPGGEPTFEDKREMATLTGQTNPTGRGGVEPEELTPGGAEPEAKTIGGLEPESVNEKGPDKFSDPGGYVRAKPDNDTVLVKAPGHMMRKELDNDPRSMKTAAVASEGDYTIERRGL